MRALPLPKRKSCSCVLECPVVEPFWKEAITWCYIKRSDNSNLNYCEILYGYKPESKSFYALNRSLLIAKYHIFLARNQSESPSLKVFLVLLESKIRCERQLDHSLHLRCVKFFSLYLSITNPIIYVLT